jgi:hypothetical protein
MALEVYFKDDIAQGIVAVTVAMLSTADAHGWTNVEYVRGALDLARAQALNYGIPWASLKRGIVVTLSCDVRALIGE